MRSAAALIAICAAAAPAAERVPAPEPLPQDEHVLAYAVIPSLATLLDHAEAAANAFTPLPKGMLAMQAGGALGDPGLANLDDSKPIVILVLAGAEAGDPPEVSAWLPAKDPQKYLQSAAALSGGGVVSGTRAVLAQTADAATHAQPLASVVEALAAPKADIRLRIAGERLMAKYRETLEAKIDDMLQLMAGMPHAPGGADPSAILGLELRGLMAFAHDLRDCQVDLTLGDTIASDASLVAIPGSPLAKALIAPAATGAKAASLIGPGEGVVTVVGAYDGKAAGAYLAQLLREVAAKPGAAPIDDRIIAFIDDASTAFDGEIAMRMTVDADGRLGGIGATGISSPEAERRMYEGLSALTAEDGPIGKLYADLGIPLHMHFETGVRQIGDAQVDRMTMELDASKMPPDQAKAMAAMMKPWEFVRTPHWNLTAEDPAALDALMARAKEAAPAGSAHTAAEDAIGAGRDFYVDYDLIAMMKASMAAGAGPGPAAELVKPMRDALAELPAEPPMLAAATFDHGALRAEVRAPLKGWADFAKAMQKAMQPRRKQRQGGAEAH